MKVDYIHHCGSDLTTVNAARVSFDKESSWDSEWVLTGNEGGEDGPEGYDLDVLSNKDEKLTHYLANHEHTSPFNHSFLSVRVKAPIFVARQLVKHKFMPWNEVSRRYVDSEPEFYEPEVWRKRADNVKQGSHSSGLPQHEVNTELCNREEANGYVRTPNEGNEDCLITYNNLLQMGVCPEQARMVLPQSMYTEWYWSGTLGAFLDMLKLRLKPDTQQETREIAEMVAEIVKLHWPVAYEARLQ